MLIEKRIHRGKTGMVCGNRSFGVIRWKNDNGQLIQFNRLKSLDIAVLLGSERGISGLF